ncbi:MAG: PAS domain S-box protein [Pseudomonadota bacterium]
MISKIFNFKIFYQDDEAVLLFWQKKIFKSLFIVLIALGSIPYILSCIYAFDSSEWHRILFYTLIYLWGTGVSLFVLFKAVEISGNAFKLLIKNTSDIIWTMDQNYTITFVNPAVRPILGFSQKEMIGRPMTDFFNDFKPSFLDPLENETSTHYETVMNHKDGSAIDVAISVSRINYFSKKHMVYQGLIRDISQKKFQEKEQQRLKEKLIRAEKLERFGILAASVAHDLNNILSGIATYPEVLMMNDRLDPDIRKSLGIIKDSGQKASAVVSDLLTVARGTSAEMEILNLNSIIHRYSISRDFKKTKTTYPNVKIEIDTEPELLNIKGSYIHIEKTIMNLVYHAVEEVYKQSDSRVCITTTNNYIDPSLSGYEDVALGEYVILQVTDNGCGIEKHHIQNIFDPFFTKKEMGKSGTGLGLTVVWNAVQDHNGYIFVTPSTKGTCFEVLFPAVRQEIPIKTRPYSIEDIKGQGQLILVVDDLKDQQTIALTILNSLGYKAQSVDNGIDAVEFIKTRSVDLVILDMIMAPSISGLETYRLIQTINPGQKAILASGYSKSNDVSLAQDLGAGSFIKKPYTLLDMGIAIKEELTNNGHINK